MKIQDIVDSLDEGELKRLKEDDFALRKCIEERLSRLDEESRMICVTCGTALAGKEGTFTLHFDTGGFKKRASFCEIDCLEYFLNKLKGVKSDDKNID